MSQILMILPALLVAMMLVMSLAFAVQRMTGNSGWIDVTWTFGTGLVATGGVLAIAPNAPRAVVIAILLVLWALRLGTHIALRSARGVDDPRYAALMKEWGANAPLRLFLFLQVQALAGTILAVAALVAARNLVPDFGWVDAAALILALTAIGGEALADAQLRACAKDRAAVCERGLWGWSRHPNYFFEFLFWCALPVFALAGGGPFWPGVLSVLAPIQMYVLLAHVSGVPPLEAHMARSRGTAFLDYQRRVSRFFPWPPVKSPASRL